MASCAGCARLPSARSSFQGQLSFRPLQDTSHLQSRRTALPSSSPLGLSNPPAADRGGWSRFLSALPLPRPVPSSARGRLYSVQVAYPQRGVQAQGSSEEGATEVELTPPSTQWPVSPEQEQSTSGKPQRLHGVPSRTRHLNRSSV